MSISGHNELLGLLRVTPMKRTGFEWKHLEAALLTRSKLRYLEW